MKLIWLMLGFASLAGANSSIGELPDRHFGIGISASMTSPDISFMNDADAEIDYESDVPVHGRPFIRYRFLTIKPNFLASSSFSESGRSKNSGLGLAMTFEDVAIFGNYEDTSGLISNERLYKGARSQTTDIAIVYSFTPDYRLNFYSRIPKGVDNSGPLGAITGSTKKFSNPAGFIPASQRDEFGGKSYHSVESLSTSAQFGYGYAWRSTGALFFSGSVLLGPNFSRLSIYNDKNQVDDAGWKLGAGYLFQLSGGFDMDPIIIQAQAHSSAMMSDPFWGDSQFMHTVSTVGLTLAYEF